MSPEDHQRRCPRIGGPVRFSYCRTCGDNGGYCYKAVDCWWEIFDVVAHLRESLSEGELADLTASRPKPKVASLVELIAAAKENCKKA